MRRLPILATFIVALAVTAMVALGFWQLGRARWKEALLASYRAGATAPPLDGLPADRPADELAFRRSRIMCGIVTAPAQLGGVNAQGKTGFRNIVGCALIDGRLIMVDLGWSPVGSKPALPSRGKRIEADGLLIPDEVLARRVFAGQPRAIPLLLVLRSAVPGLEPSVPPSIENIPNNHRGYAVQWFLFAGVAIAIYLLALRKRNRRG